MSTNPAMSTNPETDVAGGDLRSATVAGLAAGGQLRSALVIAASIGRINHGCTPDERATLEAAADVLAEKPEVAALFRAALNADADLPECTFTHAHTRHFCGSPRCRES